MEQQEDYDISDLGAEAKNYRMTNELKDQDRFLPIANIAKIMKKGIPSGGKVAKDAKECVQECVSEFISFLTSEASERCQAEKRKTINGEDILWAMTQLGLDNYMEPMKVFLTKYRESIQQGQGKTEDMTGNVIQLREGITTVSVISGEAEQYFQEHGVE